MSTNAGSVAEPADETIAQRLTRLRREVAADQAAPDVRFLNQIVSELGLHLDGAVATLDEIAKLAESAKAEELPEIAQIARVASRRTNLQAGHYGLWHRSDIVLPTEDANTSVEVLFCTERARMPIQGIYRTDAQRAGRWEIYSGIQDYVLAYEGPCPPIWCYAPTKPAVAFWPAYSQPHDAPLRYDSERFATDLAADLAATAPGVAVVDILRLPSIARVRREADQVRAAYLRTADALGVPANAHAPADRARAIVESLRQRTASPDDPK